MTRRRIALWAFLLIAAAGLAYVALMPRASEVETISVARGEATRALAVNGRIRPRLSVAVQSPVSGTLLELPYDVGDQVAAGAPIARVDDGPQRAAIAEASAAIAAQEAVLAQARRDYDRFAALGEFVSKRQLEEARLAVQEGARELERRRASRVQTQEVQQRSVLRAPFAGVILERPVDRGQTVGPETVIYRLADLNAPEVSAEVDEIYAAELRIGMIGQVEVPGRPGTLRAEVAHIEPRVDEATGAREVRLRFLEPLAAAPQGQTVSVNLVVERRPDAISIPRAAILSPDTDPRVRVIGADGRVAERRIRFVDWPAVEVIVTQGLESGARVLADPTAAEPGARVKPAG